jgi:hypothetical protein
MERWPMESILWRSRIWENYNLKKRNEIEHENQVAFFQYVDLKLMKEYPFLDKLLFSVPNGGHRSKAQAGKLKAEGVRSGVSDIILLYPARGFNYLCIEMKAPLGKQTDNQKKFENRVDENGGLYQVAYSSNDALSILAYYLKESN